jgi:hypothetical protein
MISNKKSDQLKRRKCQTNGTLLLKVREDYSFNTAAQWIKMNAKTRHDTLYNLLQNFVHPLSLNKFIIPS